ncbi:hypothetical protein IQ273_16935 [Nodosilinea sp. LEGE 07298]|uniref:hypothetical protein n=1 Tax=Nodosilinea sp. LEGE 07298 TaxID=2777970 RepID=UPI0018820C29|nr:hypothetical protein [Nodosilinea sp. LEGE 07298]MBE9111094.1 hypothetical protein [Nodosilinea sp. LEGE 07298]
MVRPVESIRKDLSALEGATATLAEEFSQIYATYLSVLGQAMRRQVIMATYHLCTQVYPEDFLALTVSDRARLQKAMQSLGHKAQGWLQQLMEPDQTAPKIDLTQRLNPEDLNRLETALASLSQPSEAAAGDEVDESDQVSLSDDDKSTEGAETDAIAPETPAIPESSPLPLAAASSEELSPEESLSEESSPDSESDEATETAAGIDPKALMQSVIMAAMANEIEETFSDRPFTGDPLTPTLVAKHHLILEQMIRAVLERVSRKANNLLRKAKVIPDLPESVLEVASDADVAAPKGHSVPNVLNVLVAMAGDVAAELDRPEQDSDGAEAEIAEISEDDAEALEGAMTHLAAIHLRLGDIEFGDVQSALWRSKLRTAVGRLRKLGKQYQQAERELAIAQAEQAWRSVWYDDTSR